MTAADTLPIEEGVDTGRKEDTQLIEEMDTQHEEETVDEPPTQEVPIDDTDTLPLEDEERTYDTPTQEVCMADEDAPPIEEEEDEIEDLSPPTPEVANVEEVVADDRCESVVQDPLPFHTTPLVEQGQD